MKTRSGYVSNSSSSSFLVAYDKSFYGDLTVLLRGGSFGFETTATEFSDLDSAEEFVKGYFDGDDGIMNECLEKVRTGVSDGKTIAHVSLDRETDSIMALLEQISEMNGGGKIDIIYGECE